MTNGTAGAGAAAGATTSAATKAGAARPSGVATRASAAAGAIRPPSRSGRGDGSWRPGDDRYSGVAERHGADLTSGGPGFDAGFGGPRFDRADVGRHRIAAAASAARRANI